MSNNFLINNIVPTEINFNSSAVNSVYYNNQLIWKADSNPTYAVTFTSPGQFHIELNYHWNGKMEYSKDHGETWVSTTGSPGNYWAAEHNGEYVISFRGIGNTTVCNSPDPRNKQWKIDSYNYIPSPVKCSGILECLLDYQTVMDGGHPPMADEAFYMMFYNCDILADVSGLRFPSVVAPSCFNRMFEWSGISKGPSILPATTLADSCYYNMFYACQNLIRPPVLPATTLADSCYDNMFGGCSSLTYLPALPATTLAEKCYYSMFNGSNIQISPTTTQECLNEYRIPFSGTATNATDATSEMFGSYDSPFTPEINTTYYVNVSVIS